MTDSQTGEDRDRYCNGKLRGEPREDGRTTCERPAGWGTDHPGIGYCKLHGGATRAHGRAAQVEGARRAVKLWGGRSDVHPATALLELVSWKAAEVQYWRGRVEEIQDDEALTFGVTKVKTGGDDHGTTEEAKPHIALVLLHKAEADLAAYAAAALKAGVEERMVQVAQATAGQFRQVITIILADPRLGISAGRDVLDAVVADGLRKGLEG